MFNMTSERSDDCSDIELYDVTMLFLQIVICNVTKKGQRSWKEVPYTIRNSIISVAINSDKPTQNKLKTNKQTNKQKTNQSGSI